MELIEEGDISYVQKLDKDKAERQKNMKERIQKCIDKLENRRQGQFKAKPKKLK